MLGHRAPPAGTGRARMEYSDPPQPAPSATKAQRSMIRRLSCTSVTILSFLALDATRLAIPI